MTILAPSCTISRCIVVRLTSSYNDFDSKSFNSNSALRTFSYAHLLEFICGDFWNVDFADVLWEFWCFVRMNVCNFFAENFCMQLFSSYLPKMHKGSDDMHFSERIHHFQDASLSFGRPGAGAPVRTKSGRLRSTVVGNPEIRSSSSLSSSLSSPLSSSSSSIIIIITIVHWCISNLWICLKSDFQTLGSKRTKECRNRFTTTSDMLSQPRRSRYITQSLVSAGEES